MIAVARRRIFEALTGILILAAVVLAFLPHAVSVEGKPYKCGPVVMTMVPSDPGSERDRAALDPCHHALKPFVLATVSAAILTGGSLYLAVRGKSSN
jgi:hypothetical protein